MDVSVIIVNYNTKNLTKACINSIFSQTKDISFEVILVDNASTDGSKDFFRKDPRIVFLESETNLGFGKANNLGFEHSKGEYIFLLNSDTIILNNAIKIFYDKAQNKDFGCLGTYLLDKNLKPNNSYGHFPKIPNLLFKAFWGHFKKVHINTYKDEDDFKKVEIVIGADLFIRRTSIEKHGLFDPIYFMYHEEDDMQKRYQLQQLDSYLISGPKIIHLEGKSNMINIDKYIMQMNGTFIYLKKWKSKFSYFIFRILYFIIRTPIMLLHSKYSFRQKITYISNLLSKV